MITLQEITTGNPFEDHPQLRAIWPAEFTAIAEEAALEAVEHVGTADIGGLFLIMRGADVIGITGYFYFDDIDEPYLRWHGIVPTERGHGYSRAAMALVVKRVRAKLPSARGLTELVPQNEQGAAIERHFISLGFRRIGAQERYDWSPYAWQPVRLNLDEAVPHGRDDLPGLDANAASWVAGAGAALASLAYNVVALAHRHDLGVALLVSLILVSLVLAVALGGLTRVLCLALLARVKHGPQALDFSRITIFQH